MVAVLWCIALTLCSLFRIVECKLADKYTVGVRELCDYVHRYIL